MVRYDVYEEKVRALYKTLEEAGYSLDVDNLRKKLKELEAELEKPEVWSDIEKSKHLSREAQGVRNKLEVFDKANKAVSDAEVMIQLAEEEGDESVLEEVDKDLSEAEKEIEDIRLRTLLKGKYDSCDAILTLHAGAGGTEACDWTEMLYRMYIC